MSRWIVALPLIAVGVSIGDSRGASAVSVVEPLAGAFTPAQRRLAQAPTRIPKSALTVHLHHHLGRSSKRPAHGPLSAVFAKARSTVVPTVSIGDDNASLRPHSVSTIRIPATVTSSSVAPQAEASSDRGLGRRRDVADAVTNIVVLADTYDDVRMSPMWPEPPPSPARRLPKPNCSFYSAPVAALRLASTAWSHSIRNTEGRVSGYRDNLAVVVLGLHRIRPKIPIELGANR
jgi:hypothetical protein